MPPGKPVSVRKEDVALGTDDRAELVSLKISVQKCWGALEIANISTAFMWDELCLGPHRPVT